MRRKLQKIYRCLYKSFGPQHWWPADSRFEVMVGAILTQNTNWQNVERAIACLKERNLLRPRQLLRLPQGQLARLIRASGYYNIKARRLHNFLRFFCRRYQASTAKLAAVPTPKLRRELLGINGIGQETADSMLLYALNKPVFVIDAYTKRIFSRHRLLPGECTYEEAQALFSRHLKPNAKLFNEYHALLVKLGKDYCRKRRPRCQVCPLK
jgi:endonuclease-3 related protein